MSNRALWDVRKRHVWLSTPLKGKRMKRRERLRVGLQQAMDRKTDKKQEEQQPEG